MLKMEKSIRPVNDFVAIRTDPDIRKSDGGIILPNSDNVQKIFGIIVAIPDPVPSFMSGRVKVGDHIMFMQNSRQVLERDVDTGEELSFVAFYDILGVLMEE